MLKNCAAGAAFAVLLACTVSPARAAQPAVDARRMIQSAYDRRDAAFGHKDAAAAMADYDPAFVSIAKSGKTSDLKALRAEIERTFAAPSRYQSVTTVKSIAIHGDSAFVRTGHIVHTMVLNPYTKKQSDLRIDAQSDDVWVKVGAAWKQRSSHALAVSMTMDGRKMPGG